MWIGLLLGSPPLVPADDTAAIKKTAVTEEALKKLKLPGVKINLEERCVDVAAEVCLDVGMLELVACTKDTKEHESIVAIDAKAIHIHTALLLLGAKSGNPAMRKQVGEGEKRWVEIDPKGGAVDVFLVFKNKAGKMVEHPISKFIERADAAIEDGADEGGNNKKSFPTHRFLFAGSHLVAERSGPKTYLSDRSGNVISISTFGDELLCLRGTGSHENGSLLWQIDATHLPAVDTKVTLRLRPVTKQKSKS